MKITPAALLFTLLASSTPFADGNVEIFTAGSKDASTLTAVKRPVDLVAQPRLADS